MVAAKAASRAVSVASNTGVRDTLKRRNKPYKTEQQKILTKRRKLNVKTSYHMQSPTGYTFLPLGVPALSNLCKELSRKHGKAVNVVHAATGHPDARNPGKVSHHGHRVGFHFRCEVVEEACEALGYVPFEGTFMTIADLQQKQHNNIVSKAFAKFGLNYDRVQGNEETPEQIRAAIMELYPRIPQDDLDAIISHSWEKGKQRVGHARDIPLSRRVQLAVGARIRHEYTDYDALLGAFGDWKGVRNEVEPETLKKLIEWRGETGDDDETLEEIVRETIVIDDDDDDDESSHGGDTSDSSIEITHRPAAEEDLRAEEASERDHRFFQRRRPEHVQAQRNDIARQKIQAFRSMERNAHAYTQNKPFPWHTHPNAPVHRIYAPAHDTADPPRQVVVGGQVLRLVRNEAPASFANPAGPYLQQDRPMQSIERADRVNSPPSPYRSQPTTPQATRPKQRQIHQVDLTQDSPGHAQPLQNYSHRQFESRHPISQAHHSREIVDLTSSPRRVPDGRQPRPEIIRVVSTGDGRYVEAPVGHNRYIKAPESVPRAQPAEAPQAHGRYYDANPAEYDPNRPLLDVRETGPFHTAPSSRYASPASPPWRQPAVQYGYPATFTHPAPVPQSRSIPAPVHGAPAPVQQMPRELAPAYRTAHRRYELTAAEAVRQAADAAPQQAQYYPR